MTKQRKIEIFSAGCEVCEDMVALVQENACPSCNVEVLDMKDPKVAKRAKELEIRSLPSVVIDGKVADCCGRGPDLEVLKGAGLNLLDE